MAPLVAGGLAVFRRQRELLRLFYRIFRCGSCSASRGIAPILIGDDPKIKTIDGGDVNFMSVACRHLGIHPAGGSQLA